MFARTEITTTADTSLPSFLDITNFTTPIGKRQIWFTNHQHTPPTSIISKHYSPPTDHSLHHFAHEPIQSHQSLADVLLSPTRGFQTFPLVSDPKVHTVIRAEQGINRNESPLTTLATVLQNSSGRGLYRLDSLPFTGINSFELNKLEEIKDQVAEATHSKATTADFETFNINFISDTRTKNPSRSRPNSPTRISVSTNRNPHTATQLHISTAAAGSPKSPVQSVSSFIPSHVASHHGLTVPKPQHSLATSVQSTTEFNHDVNRDSSFIIDVDGLQGGSSHVSAYWNVDCNAKSFLHSFIVGLW